jgi:hypothetical protein
MLGVTPPNASKLFQTVAFADRLASPVILYCVADIPAKAMHTKKINEHSAKLKAVADISHFLSPLVTFFAVRFL